MSVYTFFQLGALILGASCCEGKADELRKLRAGQARILKIVLLINALMFFVELVAGILANSSSLLGDALDMLGDATVYGFSLYVLDRGPRLRATAALMKGGVMTAFALLVLGESIRKCFIEILPVAETIGVVGIAALVANSLCLWLLWSHRSDDINMRSTWLCSRNDIIANIGVIAAAVVVGMTGTKWADLAVGVIIAGIFLHSAVSVLQDAWPEVRNRVP